MSVGPGKIRVFRAGEGEVTSQPIKRVVIKKKAKVTSSSVVRSTSAAAKPHSSLPFVALEPIRVQYRLLLTDKQKTKLESLFMAPKALAALIRGYQEPLKTAADASVFLLTNRKELDSYISPESRERSVDLLTELLLQWAGNPPASIGIDFEDVSLTPDNKVYLPLDGFRTVDVESPHALLKERKDRRFATPFTLFEKGNQFYVAFTLEPKAKPSQKLTQVQPNSEKPDKPKEIKLLPGKPLPYISGRRDDSPEPRQRILFSKYSGVFRGGLKTMNWGGLSGWGVNGGLPSLGKRSR